MGVNRDEGFSGAFDPGGGEYPDRQLINQMFKELYGLGKELNEGGVLEWSDQVDFVQYARTRGDDGELYRSAVPTGPGTGNSLNPSTKTDDSVWILEVNLPDLSDYITTAALQTELGSYVTDSGLNSVLAAYALLDSPVFTGSPEAPLPNPGDDSDRIANTAWVQGFGGVCDWRRSEQLCDVGISGPHRVADNVET